MAQIEVKVKLDLPVGVELLGYERCGDGHGFEVKFPLPLYCRCEKCGAKDPANYEGKNTVSFRQACMNWHEIYGIVASCQLTNFGRAADGCQENARDSGSAAAGSGAI